MSFPQVVSSATDANKNGFSVALTMPSGLVVGNLLLIVAGVSGSAGFGISGWTQVVVGATSTGGSHLAAYAKAVTASNSASILTSDFSVQDMAVFTYQISGWTGVIADVTGTAGNPGAGSFAPNPPNHTAAFNRDNLWIAAGLGNGFPTQTAPASYTNVVQVGVASNAAQICGARRELAAASENPGAFGQTYTSSVIQMTVSVPPALDPSSPPWRRLMPPLLAR